MKILFLFPYPLRQAPSQRFRFEQYLEALIGQGYTLRTQAFWGEHYWQILYSKGRKLHKLLGLLNGLGRRLRMLGSASAADLVFIHREAAPLGPPVFEWIIAKVLRKKIIYDFDDAIWLPNTSDTNRPAAWLKWHSKTGTICRWAWKVSVGNSFLAQYAGVFSQHVIINPTTIDLQHHNPGHFPVQALQPVIIGWTGSHSTLPYLMPLWPVLEQLASKVSFRFLVIASEPPPVHFPWLDFVEWSSHTEIADLAKIDIGVMPLADSDWSRGKCGFKALQYMAMGIPAVASPVGVNKDIIRNGENGFLCSTSNEWLASLSNLLTDSALRKKMGTAGRQTVEHQYSTASNMANFLSLFASL